MGICKKNHQTTRNLCGEHTEKFKSQFPFSVTVMMYTAPSPPTSMAVSKPSLVSGPLPSNLRFDNGQEKNSPFTLQQKLLVLAIVGIAMFEIVSSYHLMSQAFDEPCHVAAGIEFLDRGTYRLDAVHPPLSRVFIAAPLYIAGERYPRSGAEATSTNYNVVGNAILYDSGKYQRNLTLARLGVLPFFVFAALVVFWWAHRQYGTLPAILSTALFTTLPIILAFSGIAYSDMAAASTQTAALFAFVRWLGNRSRNSTMLFGAALGLALLAKATTLIFLPATIAIVLGTRWLQNARSAPRESSDARHNLSKQIAAILAIAALITWGGYKFSIGRIDEALNLSAQNMPSFQHFPGPVRVLARRLVLSNPAVPAPALLQGLAEAWVLNKNAPESYLLGKTKAGGWWYFFLVGIAVKTPLPFLVFLLIGAAMLLRSQKRWEALAPLAAAVGILLVTMPVTYNAGVRHVLAVFPLFSIVAGRGCAALWQWSGTWQRVTQPLAVTLLACQLAICLTARGDYIGYFNPLAGHDPSRVLLTGCDLDCGQDVSRLAEFLNKRHVAHANVALWSSADLAQMGVQNFSVPAPYQPVTGWLAISRRSLRLGDVFHSSYPPGAFDWLKRYQPIAHVGKTILVYEIPESGPLGGALPRLQY